jgi:microcin C transport system substrate-binding protein
MSRLALLAAAVIATAAPAWADTTVRHGVSVFGDLKYPADFAHFAYVNPNAPKGGTLRLMGIDTFDNLNPFILKGVNPDELGRIFDTLMTRAYDEPDALYGLVAKSVEMPDDGGWIEFHLRPEARFHDGTKITADDVVFTYETLIDKGHPRYRILYDGVAKVTAPDAHTVRFDFTPGRHRDLPVQLAEMPVLSRAWGKGKTFDKTTMDPPLGSGPYKVAAVEPGRWIEFRRVKDYWAKDLPVNVGRNNFDTIRLEFFRDRDVALEAFFGGAYDWREEFTSRDWATKYVDKPQVLAGKIVRESIPDHTPSGVQAWFFNLRRAKFRDVRVREALDLAFDFQWTNRSLFFGMYKRTTSMFENSSLAAHGPPSAAELALLEPLKGEVPPEVFEKPFAAPEASDQGALRRNLRQAAKLLAEAGWTVRNGHRENAKGEPLSIEFLIFESSFQRIINPYIRNLERLGIDARVRVVDVANFINREQNYDYDVVVERYVQYLTPGIEQRNYWGSKAADTPGSRNLAGIKDKAVDALIDKVTGADSRPALVAAVGALDRVLMWNHYCVPQWYNTDHHIAYWNKFSRPKVTPRYDPAMGVVDTWWFDPAKAAKLAAEGGQGQGR